MDLKVVETLNGGDLVKTTKDLKVIYGLESMPYLALFGGNVQESTPSARIPNRQYYDWWGNNLFFPKNQSLQFNSETERILKNVALTSFGRTVIEEAVKKDLQFFKGFADVQVVVSIISDDRIILGIKIIQQVFVYIWDATNQELTDADFIVSSPPFVTVKIFDSSFDFSFE